MPKEKIKRYPNQLTIARRQRGLGRKCVARLIGHRSIFMLARYEEGRALPPLPTALKLEVLYRSPVAFLWPGLYSELRQQVRHREEGEAALSGGVHAQ